MGETKEVRQRSASGTASKRLQFLLPCFSQELADAALQAVAEMAGDLRATAILVFVNVVPFPLLLDRPDVDIEHIRRTLGALTATSPIPSRVLMVLARDRELAVRNLIPAGSLVVLATQKRWWRTAEEALARALRRDEPRVVLLTVGASECGNGGRHPLPGIELPGARKGEAGHA